MPEYVVDGRITAMPRSTVERRAILDWLVEDFEVGQRYSESMVNLIVGQRHPDAAAWRRALVDEGLMARDHGEYRRTPPT